jgi:hypothetical protein
MGVQRGAREGCGILYGEGVSRSVWVMWGTLGRLWLGRKGGGEGLGGPGSALVGQGQRSKLLHAFF